MHYTAKQLREMIKEEKRANKKANLLKQQKNIRFEIQFLYKKFQEVKEEIIRLENQSPTRDRRNQANISGLKNVNQLIIGILANLHKNGKKQWTVNDIIGIIADNQKHIGIPINVNAGTIRSSISYLILNNFLEVSHNLPGKGSAYVLCFPNHNLPKEFKGVKVKDLAKACALS